VAKVSWITSIQIVGGPTLSATQAPIAVEATDHIQVTIGAGDVDKIVNIQPGAANRVLLLVVTSSNYGEGTSVTFKVGDGTADSAAIHLAGPQVYSGGSVALFGVAPKLLKFSNASTSAADIDLFVARNATP
jgi:hypothetical protein